MSRITNDIINSLRKSMKASDRKTSAYDTQATIRRIEGNTAWVHIPGGVDETPVQLTINAKEGDQVQVRVSGGRAFLVGNATAPPTDDSYAKKLSMNIKQEMKSTGSVIRRLNRLVESVKDIASNTNQYFWHTEEGTDTGAHITEIPQEEFLADPANGGGNLLARSNGVAVRDGLDELSIFSNDGVRIGKASEGHMEVTNHEVIGRGGRGIYFDMVGPLYADTEEAESHSWTRTTPTDYTGYPSYPSGTVVLLVSFGLIDDGATVHIEIDYYNNSSTQATYSANFVGGTTETVYNGALFGVTYDANADQIYLTSLSSSVYFSGGFASASRTYAQTNNMQFIFGKQTGEYEGGNCSASIGIGCDAKGDYSLATGQETLARGVASFAEGEFTSAIGEASHAEGCSSNASASYSHAEGYGTSASARCSHTSGIGTHASTEGQTSVGRYNTTKTGRVFVVGTGTDYDHRRDSLEVTIDGIVMIGQQLRGVVETRSTNIITAQVGITIVGATMARFGQLVQIYIRWSRSNTPTIVPAIGNITNVDVGTLAADLRPVIFTAAHSHGDDAGAAWYKIDTNGLLTLGACEGTGSERGIAAGTVFSVMATYIVRS
jgi:hypothetical protein